MLRREMWVGVGAAILGACATLLSPAPGRAGEEPAAAVPDFSGHWRLNEALSSGLPASKPAEGASSEPGKDGGGEAPVDGSEKGGGARGHRGAAPGASDNDPRGEAETKTSPEINVLQTEMEIVVDEKGSVAHYYPNGHTYKADEGNSDVRSLWRGDQLVFEKKSRQGWRLTQTWQLSPDRRRLTVTLHVEGGRRPKADLKRVYDRIDAQP
jgi:hypothetical protein